MGRMIKSTEIYKDCFICEASGIGQWWVAQLLYKHQIRPLYSWVQFNAVPRSFDISADLGARF